MYVSSLEIETSDPTTLPLTHLNRIEFSSLINWTSTFPFFMVFFIFIQILKENSVANSVDTDQTQRSAASALGLHCLYMPHKMALG